MNTAIKLMMSGGRSGWQVKGVTVLRFWNNDVLGNIEGVWQEIARTAATLSLRPATPTPTLPLSGGGSTRSLRRR